MNFLRIDKYVQNKEVLIIIGIILGILVFATILFFILGKLKPGDKIDELKMRTRSWWVMASIFVLATLLHPVVSFIAFGLLSFAALRELTSISKNVRDEDRRVLIWCYLAIPIQYFLAYNGWFNIFIIVNHNHIVLLFQFFQNLLEFITLNQFGGIWWNWSRCNVM